MDNDKFTEKEVHLRQVDISLSEKNGKLKPHLNNTNEEKQE